MKRYLLYGSIAIAIGLSALGGYARIWEYRQPKQGIINAVVASIEPYSLSGDLHIPSRGYRVFIHGEDRPIDFPLKHWDNTVKVGDNVEMVVRRSFPLFGNELDGLVIDDNK